MGKYVLIALIFALSACSGASIPEDAVIEDAATVAEEVSSDTLGDGTAAESKETEPQKQQAIKADFSETTIHCNPTVIYKGKENPFCELQWNVGPDQLGEGDSIRLYSQNEKWESLYNEGSGKLNAGTRQININGDDVIEFQIFREDKSKAVETFHYQLPLVDVEADLEFKVDFLNMDGEATKTVHLNPENNYLENDPDGKKIRVVYEAEAPLDKVCFLMYQKPETQQFRKALSKFHHYVQLSSSPQEPSAPSAQLDKMRWVDVAKFGDSSEPAEADSAPAPIEECYERLNGELKGEFELTLDSSMIVEPYAIWEGEEYQRNQHVLTLDIAKPKVEHRALRAIPDSEAKRIDIINKALSPIVEYEIDASEAQTFVLVTNATDRFFAADADLQKIEPWGGTLNPVLVAKCNWHPGMLPTTPIPESNSDNNEENVLIEASSIKVFKAAAPVKKFTENPCHDQALRADAEKRFSAEQREKGLHVYVLNAQPYQDIFYLRPTPGVYDLRFIVFGKGYQDKWIASSYRNVNFPQPKIDEFCSQEKKADIFQWDTARVQGHIYGLKSLSVSTRDIDAPAPEVSPDYDKGEGSWRFNVGGSYTGSNPGFTFDGEDITGMNIKALCSWGKVQPWPITVELADIHVDSKNSNTEVYDFIVRMSEQDGPKPLTHWRMKVPSGCRIDGGKGDMPIDYTGYSKLKRTFSIGNVGMDCWQIKLQVKDLDGKWRYVRYSNPTMKLDHEDYIWNMSKLGSVHPSAYISFPPTMKFEADDLKKTQDECTYHYFYDAEEAGAPDRCDDEVCLDRHQVQWTIPIKHISYIEATKQIQVHKDIFSDPEMQTVPCGFSGYEVSNVESDQLIIKADWKGYKRSSGHSFKCTLKAHGPALQVKEIQLDSSRCQPADEKYPD